MSSSSTIALGRFGKVFAVKEDVPGTIKIPAATNLIVHNSAEVTIPNPNYEEDKAVRNSRSDFNRYQIATPQTPFKLTHYLRPSGAAGTAPEGSDVIESAYGTKTVVGSTSVAYTPASVQPSFTLWVKKDFVVYVAAGAVAKKISAKKDNKSMLEANIEGDAMSSIWTGTGSFSAAIVTTPAPGTEEEFTVDDPKKWCTNSHLLCDTEQMKVTGTAWEGTAAAGKIKVARGHNSSTVATHLINAVITPWLPTGTEQGAPIAARVGTMTVDAVSVPFVDCEFTHEGQIKMLDDEVTQSTGVSDYQEEGIKDSVKLKLYFRKADLKWSADSLKQTRKAVVINFGSIAGKKIAITLPSCEFDVPAQSGDKSLQVIDVTGRAFAVAGQDESEFKFL